MRSQHRVKFVMPLEQLLALAVLAFVGSSTPRPNNMIATMTGTNHGFRAALPHIFGVRFGFPGMLIEGAAGVAALLLTYPFVAALLKWAGIAYLQSPGYPFSICLVSMN
jgi:threonine/homoserine/homoserine lactone efflux protein